MAMPSVDLTIDGRVYILRLSINALCAVEERTGEAFLEIQTRAAIGHFRAVRWLFWAALQSAHYDTVKTPEDAGALMDAAGGLAAVADQLRALLQPRPDTEPSAPPTPAAESVMT